MSLKKLWRSVSSGGEEHWAWLHPNHLGAPEAATNPRGQVLWQANYQAFGAAQITPTAFTLNLRLPGQYEDAETGLHYNRHRYYDPSRGEYLTPDPLGTPDGPNPYAYVRYNPLKYIDPEGLILFAFDGTGNDESDPRALSNVVRFRDLYNDGAARYITGVGARHVDAKYGDIAHWAGSMFDMGGNYTGPDRITRMLASFGEETDAVDDSLAMDVDIIGFSRGAAQARDFANQLIAATRGGFYEYVVRDKDFRETKKCQKVNFRFMGIWDTVLSTNLSGTAYHLAIPPDFKYVAHAVALNEFRGLTLRRLPGSTGAFPLESIVGAPAATDGGTRVERGFLGSHSDVGGGFADGDLSLVALSWMVDQATKAGVSMNAAPRTVPANPVLHDKSDNQYSTDGPSPRIEDRTVRFQDGRTTTAMSMIGAGMTYADTRAFISYLPAEPGSISRTPRGDFVTGTVDMKEYLKWLNDNGYGIDLTVR